MLPSLPIFDLANGLPAHRVVLGDLSGSARVLADASDVGFSQLGVLMRFAKKKVLAVARHHVGIVVGMRAKVEMIGVAARRVIAVMQNHHPGWNRASHERPHCSMGARVFSSEARNSIAILAFGSRPFTTGTWRCLDLIYEPLQNGAVGHRLSPSCVGSQDPYDRDRPCGRQLIWRGKNG